ncbi:MAG: hypothetical protein ACTSUE_04035, partial [Promethearchaeota archaeon]
YQLNLEKELLPTLRKRQNEYGSLVEERNWLMKRLKKNMKPSKAKKSKKSKNNTSSRRKIGSKMSNQQIKTEMAKIARLDGKITKAKSALDTVSTSVEVARKNIEQDNELYTALENEQDMQKVSTISNKINKSKILERTNKFIDITIGKMENVIDDQRELEEDQKEQQAEFDALHEHMGYKKNDEDLRYLMDELVMESSDSETESETESESEMESSEDELILPSVPTSNVSVFTHEDQEEYERENTQNKRAILES